MGDVAIFLIDGFEETEALCTVDILRRGSLNVKIIALNDEYLVRGKHDIRVMADLLLTEAHIQSFEASVIPGGTTDYLDHAKFLEVIQFQAERQVLLAAICAAPAVFGKLGLLDGKNATCYPGMESYLGNAICVQEPVVRDGQFITSRGPGTTVPFALRILEELRGADVAQHVAADFLA